MVYLCGRKKKNRMDKRKKYLEMALSVDDPAVIAGKGQNKIPDPEKEPLWKRYLEKFKDPLIIILLVALFLSCFVSSYEIMTTGNWRLLFEPIGVLFAILLSTGPRIRCAQSGEGYPTCESTAPSLEGCTPSDVQHPEDGCGGG